MRDDTPGPVGNVADLIRRAAGRGPARPALISDDQVLTWGTLDAYVDAVVLGLRALAAAPGDRVAIALPNVPEFAAALFGVLRSGLVAVPINPGYTARELRHVLTDSGARALLATPTVAGAVAAFGDELPAPLTVYTGTDLAALLSAGRSPAVDVPRAGGTPSARPGQVPAGDAGASSAGGPPLVGGARGGEDLAMLLYTSGTSGMPKGAMLSHRALLANHAQLDRVSPALVGPEDVVLLALPLFHAYGLNTGLCAVAYHAATAVMIERFDPADALELIDRYRVSVVVGVPPMFVAWSLLADVGEALATVRLMVSGAAPLDPVVAARFTAATARPVFEGYGLTETAPVLTSTVVSPAPKTGSIGRAIPGVELRLVAADGSVLWPSTVEDELAGNELDLDAPDSPGTDPGEIVVRGANLFSGYWPDGREGPDTDGWWATGDVAYADDDGDLFLVDRLGELILVSGFNVYPREVEQVLTSHPAVAAAAALGTPHPYTGQTVKAFVVRVPESTVDTEELLRYCEEHLARFKCPTVVRFVDELPYSIIGKVRKVQLHE